MEPHSPRYCLHCNEPFLPSPYAPRQRYCTHPACRKASKKASQARWLSKPENRTYFCGDKHTRRVQAWRKDHPGYWRRKQAQRAEDALQDLPTLQDLARSPASMALVGFLATQAGEALQDTVEKTFWDLHARGQSILDAVS